MSSNNLLDSNKVELLKRIRQLKLYGFADALENQFANENLYFNSSYYERIEMCIQRQEEYAKNRRFNNLLKAARFKSALEFTDISKTPSEGITTSQLRDLSENSWLSPCRNIVITGAVRYWQDCFGMRCRH